MKTLKLLMTMFALLLGPAAFAAFQHNWSTSEAVNNDSGWFDIKADSSFTLNYYNPGTKFGQITDFGYILTDSNGYLKALSSLPVYSNGSVTIEDLKAGDQLSFYLSTKNTNHSSISSVNDWNSGDRQFFNNKTQGGSASEVIWGFGDYKYKDGVLSFTATTTPASAPSGQPLPGLLASLLIGCGVLGIGLKFRRRTLAVR